MLGQRFFVGFSFPLIRSFFNSVTEKVLLKDSYDVERVLASIADIAANATSSKALFAKSSKVDLGEHTPRECSYISKE